MQSSRLYKYANAIYYLKTKNNNNYCICFIFNRKIN